MYSPFSFASVVTTSLTGPSASVGPPRQIHSVHDPSYSFNRSRGTPRCVRRRKVALAATPDPQVFTIVCEPSNETPELWKRARSSESGRTVPSFSNSSAGTETEPGICPDGKNGRGSATVPWNRPAGRPSIRICSAGGRV